MITVQMYQTISREVHYDLCIENKKNYKRSTIRFLTVTMFCILQVVWIVLHLTVCLQLHLGLWVTVVFSERSLLQEVWMYLVIPPLCLVGLVFLCQKIATSKCM